jgi:hypothetical protein
MIDIFRVGVRISMSSNGAQVLGALLEHLTRTRVEAGKLEKSLGNIGSLAIGVAAVFTGGAIVKGLADATKHAEKLNHELTKIQIGAQLNPQQVQQVNNLAFRISRSVGGTDVAENVKLQRELFGTLGDLGEAQGVAPLVAMGSRVTSAYVDKNVDLAQIAVKALELRGHVTKDGKVDPAEFAAEFSAMTRSIVASEGLVDPQKLYMFIRQAGPAVRNMSSDEMWGMAPGIINALGAGPAGTATMSLFSQMIGHVVAGKRVALAMQEAGWLTPGKWRVERGGHVVMDQDAVPDQAGFMAHPFTWLHDHLQELRNRKDAHGKPIDVVGVIQRIFQLSSRQTSARLISDVDSNWPILQNEERRWQRMPDVQTIYNSFLASDLGFNVQNFTKAFDNLMAAIGKAGNPGAIYVLRKLTSALDFLQEAATNHPMGAAALYWFAGGIGAILALGGAIRTFGLLLSPFITGVKALRGALAGAEVAEAAAAATSLATGISILVGVLTGAAVIAGILTSLKLGSDHETPETREKLEKLRKSMGVTSPTQMQTADGFNVDGTPIAPASKFSGDPLNPSGTSGAGTHGDVYLDGDKVGRWFKRLFGHEATRPPTTATAPDIRIAPSYAMPGFAGGGL